MHPDRWTASIDKKRVLVDKKAVSFSCICSGEELPEAFDLLTEAMERTSSKFADEDF